MGTNGTDNERLTPGNFYPKMSDMLQSYMAANPIIQRMGRMFYEQLPESFWPMLRQAGWQPPGPATSRPDPTFPPSPDQPLPDPTHGPDAVMAQRGSPLSGERQKQNRYPAVNRPARTDYFLPNIFKR